MTLAAIEFLEEHEGLGSLDTIRYHLQAKFHQMPSKTTLAKWLVGQCITYKKVWWSFLICHSQLRIV